MSDFFPEPAATSDEAGVEDSPQPLWLNPPEDMLPGVVPVELIIGRSDRAVVMLTRMRAFPDGLSMTLGVRTRGLMRRFDLTDEIFNEPHRHDQDDDWRRDRLKWGFEFVDGRRATNVDAWDHGVDPEQIPDHPVLSGGGGGGGDRSTDREYWLWPLPPPGSLKVVCQWLMLGIEPTISEINADQVVAAAARAVPLWAAS